MVPGIVLERLDPLVFSLPRDVLEEILIFRVNNNNPVLRDSDVRVKSIHQVCRHWQEIVMGWPSLWGRDIFFDDLNQVWDDWRTCTSSEDDMRTLDFVISIMDIQ
jgi:hypothetical protein